MNNIVVFDTETSGLSPKTGHRIIEIGAVALSGTEITGEFQSLIDADCEISWQATNVHGITNQMLRGEPAAWQVFSDFRAFIGDATLVAHNAQFDLRFLEFEFADIGFRLTNPSHCTPASQSQALAAVGKPSTRHCRPTCWCQLQWPPATPGA